MGRKITSEAFSMNCLDLTLNLKLSVSWMKLCARVLNTFTRWFWCKTPLRNAPLEPWMDHIWGNFPKYFFQGNFSERMNSKLYSQWTHLECHFSIIPIDQSCGGFNSSPLTRQRWPLIKSRETNKEVFLTGILPPLHSHASLDAHKIFRWSESRFHLFL